MQKRLNTGKDMPSLQAAAHIGKTNGHQWLIVV